MRVTTLTRNKGEEKRFNYTRMTGEESTTVVFKLCIRVCVLPRVKAAVTAMLVVGWLVVTDSSGAVVLGTVCGDEM